MLQQRFRASRGGGELGTERVHRSAICLRRVAGEDGGILLPAPGMVYKRPFKCRLGVASDERSRLAGTRKTGVQSRLIHDPSHHSASSKSGRARAGATRTPFSTVRSMRGSGARPRQWSGTQSAVRVRTSAAGRERIHAAGCPRRHERSRHAPCSVRGLQSAIGECTLGARVTMKRIHH